MGTPSKNSHRQHVAPRQLHERLGHRHQHEAELVLQARRKCTSERPRLVAPRSISSPIWTRKPSSICSVDAGHLVAGLAHQDLQQRLHEEVEVGRHHVLNVGRSTFTATTRPSCRAGAVHDGDGSRADRLALEVGEHVFCAGSSRGPLRCVGGTATKGTGGPRIEASLELVRHLVAEHPGRRGAVICPNFMNVPPRSWKLLRKAGQLAHRRAVQPWRIVRSWRRMAVAVSSGSPPPWRWCGTPAQQASSRRVKARGGAWGRFCGTSSVRGTARAGSPAGPVARATGVRSPLREPTWPG